MADQPDNQPVTPDPGPDSGSGQGDEKSTEKGTGWHEPPMPEGSSRPVIVESWFQPDDATTVEETPVAEPDADSPPSTEGLPDTAPERTGAWHTPLDAQLDALLSGAADTIVERHEPAPLPDQSAPAEDDTQVQATAETRAQASFDDGWEAPPPDAADEGTPEYEGTAITPREADAQAEAASAQAADSGEPGVPAESTPPAEATPEQPVSPGRTPAEAALLAEQRAAGEASPAGQAAVEEPEEPTPSEAESIPQRPVEPAPAPEPSRFEQVERRVSVLRRRYGTGELTEEELQKELRSLMFQDDDGRWWMLGLKTNQWYYFDGHNWVAEDPPDRDQRVRGSAVRTETGMQEVADQGGVLSGPQAAGEQAEASLDEEDDMPLPARVPQEDPGATLVSPNAAFMDPVRRSDAPTRSKSREVEADVEPMGHVEHPVGSELTQPSMVVSEPVPGEEATMRSDRGLDAAPAQDVVAQPQPQFRLGEYPQPDYSAAFGTRNRNTYVKWGIRLVVFGSIFAMILTLFALVAMVGYYFYKVSQYQDVVANLADRTADFQTTLIQDADGTTLAEFNSEETGARTEVPLDQISPWLIHATISTENETFYSDPGFSVVAIVRAAIQNVRAGDTVSGASTITQQLARALVLETEFASQRTTERKIVEISVASEIKRQFTKNEILEIYLNEIFYGNRAYGIEAATQTYFGISASELNPAQAAFLAGLPQSPATYDPVVNREAAKARMYTVLRLMSEANGTGCIAIQHDDATQWGVPNGGEMCIIREVQDNGDAKYFYTMPNQPERQELVAELARVETAPFEPPEFEAIHPHFVNYVWQQLEEEYGSQRIYSAGFRVTTTLDERIQGAAERAVSENLNALRNQGYDVENASVVVMRPTDGAIVAMVGSSDYYNEDIDGQVNVAFTAQQPGSSIKPIVYLAAFQPDEQGRYWTPATVIWDVYTDFSGYIPTNFDNQYHGPKTAREALANSLNVPAVKTMEFVGVTRFTQFAERVGLTFPLGNPVERQAGLTTALGAVEVRLFDMVRAYAMMANGGREVKPVSILRIEDSDGALVHEAPPVQAGEQIVSAEMAYLITNILSDNQTRTQEFNPGWPLELRGGRPAAVKTGTSNDSRDIWTLGFTPQYVTGVWMGNTDDRPMYTLYGSTGAAPVWNQIMEEIHAGLPVSQFVRPPGISEAEVCNDSGTLPSPECAGRTHREIFAPNAPPPPAEQGMFRTLQVDSFTGKLVNEFCPEEPETRTFLVIDDPTAYNWINNTPEGNNWATLRDLALPVQPPPTEACDPNEPRPNVVVSFPPPNMAVEGVLPLRGLVTMPNFSRYEIRLAPTHEPQNQDFTELVEVQQVQWPEPNSILGQVDTRGLANGPYTIRLTVFDVNERTVTRDVPITVNNPQPTAQPTAIPTATLAPTLTPPGTVVETPAAPGSIPTTTLAPTLTPIQ